MDLSVCVSEERGYGKGGGVYTTLSSDTLQSNGHTGTDTSTGVWLINKPMDLSVYVSEECGHGEGGGVYTTLPSDTQQSNGHTGTDTSPGVWLSNKPTNGPECMCE